MAKGQAAWVLEVVKDMFMHYYISILAQVTSARSLIYVQLRSFIESLMTVCSPKSSSVLVGFLSI